MKLEMAPCDVACCDTWQLARARYTAMRAYKALEARGAIKVCYPLLVSKNALTVKYEAQAPKEWVREALRDTEREITADLLAEQQEAQARMARMLPDLNGDTLPEFIQLKERYEYIQERLM